MGWLGNIKRFFVVMLRGLWSEIKKIISGALEIFLAELLDFAKNTVKNLENADLNNIDKENAAFKLIAEEAKARGLYYKNNWIGILVRLALEAIRGKIENG